MVTEPHIHTLYTQSATMSVPLSELGPHPPFRKRVCPAEPKGGTHSPRGVGGPNSDDWRKNLALCLLCGPNPQMYEQAQLGDDTEIFLLNLSINNCCQISEAPLYTVWFGQKKLDTCNVERGHGIPELEVLVVQTVGVVGPGSIRGRMDPPRACIIPFLFIREFSDIINS